MLESYKNKKVFITGHTGFKGSWLLSILHQAGAELKGYALAPETAINLYTEIQGDRMIDSVLADLRDKEALQKAILDFKPDFIFHLAAQPLVRRSYVQPTETFSINVIGTAHVLDAMRFLTKKCTAVFITTDKVYHNTETDYAYRESDRLGGYDPYSASKACCELVIDSYRNSFFHPDQFATHQKAIAVGRAGNVIGGGDWAEDRLIPDIARALHKQETIRIRNPYAVRPWQHVIEPLMGYLRLGAHLASNPAAFSKAYNFGPSDADALPVQEMVTKSIQTWGAGECIAEENNQDPHEAGLLKLNIEQAWNELSWKPTWNAQTAIERSIHWYQAFYAGNDAHALMQADIDLYTHTI